MRKSEMNSLVAGVKVQSKKDSTVYEIAGLDKEQQKAILTDGKVYSFSTLYRWFNLYVEPVVEEKEDTTTATTADTDTTTQDTADTEEQTNTSDLQDNTNEDDQLHNDTDTAVKKDIVEGNTDINGAEVFTNNFGVELYTNSLSGIVIKHGCKLNRMKQYIAVRSNNVKGTLIYIRVAKEGGWHFDVSKTTWNKLDTDTQVDLVEQFDACIKDRTRGLWRISNCDSLDIFEKLLTTALDIA